jgi:hypothetical protein
MPSSSGFLGYVGLKVKALEYLENKLLTHTKCIMSLKTLRIWNVLLLVAS